MSQTNTIKLPPAWLELIEELFTQPYIGALKSFLLEEKRLGKQIYPPNANIFRAFNLTIPEETKVVVIGQDPYHGDRQANGLSFSVNPGMQLPPSLQNIYKELKSDLGIDKGDNGDLTGWAEQGVLLLNSILTVRAHQPASHQGRGWESFTDQVLAKLCNFNSNLAIIAWGSFAQKKIVSIPLTGQLVIRSAHPSPLSAHRGFFGSRPFSQVNDYLVSHRLTPIDWSK